MSVASPQGPGVGTGTFPGCQETPLGGGPGINSWHIPSSPANGCQTDGSKLSVDEINGLQQAINCIFTRGGTRPLPTDCLCANPCMLYEEIIEIATEIAESMVCGLVSATQNQKDAIEANPALAEVVVCYNGTTPIKIPSDCLGAGGDDPVDPPTGCSITKNNVTGEFTVTSGTVYVQVFYGSDLCSGSSSNGSSWFQFNNGESAIISPNQNLAQVTGGGTPISPPAGLGTPFDTLCVDSESGQGLQQFNRAEFHCAP